MKKDSAILSHPLTIAGRDKIARVLSFTLQSHAVRLLNEHIPHDCRRFFVSIVVVYFLAIMASFMNVTPLFLSVAIITTIVVSFLYRDILKESMSYVRKEITALAKKR